MQKEWDDTVEQAMLAPFDPSEIDVRDGGGGRKLAYIDARTARRRLTEAAGPGSWHFDWEVIDTVVDRYVRVKGTLTVLGVTRADAGEAQFNARQVDQELVKAAVSDALKRCAACFGVGALLYEMRAGTPVNPQTIAQAARAAGWRGPVPGSQPDRPASPPARSQEPPRDASEASGRVQGDRNLTKDLADAYYAAHGSASAEKVTADLAGLLNVSEDEAAQLTKAQMIAAISLLRQQAKQNQRAAPPEREETPPAPNGNGDDMTCQGAGCGKPLTKGQRDVSQRAFSLSLCPGCQRQQARSA